LQLRFWHYLLNDEVKASWVQLEKDLVAVFTELDGEYFRTRTFVPAWQQWWCDWSQFHFERSKPGSLMPSIICRVSGGPSDTDPVRLMILNTLMQLEGYASAILIFDNTIFQSCK
jgi:hypothetical protein